MKTFYRVLVSNSVLMDGGIVSAKGLSVMKQILESKGELKSLSVEEFQVSDETYKSWDFQYHLVNHTELWEGSSSGERNIFHDINGNEYHN